MSRLTPRQVLTMLALAAVAFITASATGFDQRMVTYAFVLWIASSIALVIVASDSSGGERAFERLQRP